MVAKSNLPGGGHGHHTLFPFSRLPHRRHHRRTLPLGRMFLAATTSLAARNLSVAVLALGRTRTQAAHARGTTRLARAVQPRPRRVNAQPGKLHGKLLVIAGIEIRGSRPCWGCCCCGRGGGRGGRGVLDRVSRRRACKIVQTITVSKASLLSLVVAGSIGSGDGRVAAGSVWEEVNFAARLHAGVAGPCACLT